MRSRRRRSERTWRVFAVLVVLALLAAMVLTGALANVGQPQTSLAGSWAVAIR